MYAKYLAIAALLASVASAWAHDPKARNGGRVTEARPYHLEMVVKADTVDVFISDEGDKAVATSGFKGTAILVTGGKSQRIVLASVDGTRLSGRAAAVLPDQPKGVVQLTLPDGKTVQGKFD